jgi:hypothetical protein
MRKYIFINRSVLVLAVILITSCNGVFVPDPIDPRLPKYTEAGNNVAGAFIDQNTWESIVTIGFPGISDAPLITVWPTNDSLVIRFYGRVSDESSIIEFHLTGLNISKFEDLLRLNDKKIQLDGNRNVGFNIQNYNPTTNENKGIGQIYFKHVSVNYSLSKVILSGTFGFTVNQSTGRSTRISYGRFDYTVTKNSNFRTE